MRGIKKNPYPQPSIRRLPSYLRFLRRLRGEGLLKVSCTEIARELDLDSTQVRKDLALTGIVGRPRIGYGLADLILAIEDFLGWDRTSDAFLAGVGNLGRALIGYDNFRQCGLNIAKVFDTDGDKVGSMVFGRRIHRLGEMPALAAKSGVGLGIITVPAAAAQKVADIMAASGIKGIWNFSPVRLELPSRILVENVELVSSFAILSANMRRKRSRGVAAGHST
ncbi:MAG: redox-sensing transcriptional repressor Rex [Planctomycetota bacterium]|jgi:redox-sensing transcriptional repressor|nr:redox-sensing transcriptional repressor Rex [Planctomycetota bacterium]